VLPENCVSLQHRPTTTEANPTFERQESGTSAEKEKTSDKKVRDSYFFYLCGLNLKKQ